MGLVNCSLHRRRAARSVALSVLLLTTALTVRPAFAQEGDGELAELAKKVQNPIADLISVPIQNNMNFGYGPDDDVQNVLNIQPVIPIDAGRVTVITRTIIPLVYQPDLKGTPGVDFRSSGGTFGLGDIDFTAWISPKDSGSFIWGVGPAFLLPTGTSDKVTAQEFAMGPTAVGLVMSGPWVAGALVKNFWGVTDDAVDQFVLQYFVNYNLPQGWYLTTSPLITAMWDADSGDKWTVPFGGGFGKLHRFGKQPVNMQVQAFGNAVTPDDLPHADWTLRFQIQFIFPKGK